MSDVQYLPACCEDSVQDLNLNDEVTCHCGRRYRKQLEPVEVVVEVEEETKKASSQ